MIESYFRTMNLTQKHSSQVTKKKNILVTKKVRERDDLLPYPYILFDRCH